jgi:hypothetical protein
LNPLKPTTALAFPTIPAGNTKYCPSESSGAHNGSKTLKGHFKPSPTQEALNNAISAGFVKYQKVTEQDLEKENVILPDPNDPSKEISGKGLGGPQLKPKGIRP